MGWLLFLTLPNEVVRGWKGIIPLHSTRADVERLLGSSTGECNCLYKTEDAAVYVEYAVDRCRGGLPGWNVPKETVLRLTVTLRTAQQFSDLKLDRSKHKIRQDDTFTTYYSNKEEGIEYAVSTEGNISSISYVPSIKDKNLRCVGFPLEDGSTIDYLVFDRFGDLNFDSESARLDNFAVRLSQSSNLTGYVVVYAGKTACPREGHFRANRARDYLINRRGLDPKRIMAIDGGHRENLSVELYALPRDAERPVVVPTIAPSEVKILRGNRRCALLRVRSPRK